jgi:hypothetical protein
MLRRLACLAAIPTLALLAPGCSDDDSSSAAAGNPDDEVSYELFKSTIELDGAALSAISDNGKDGTLRFSGKPSALANVKQGSILFGGRSDKTPVGLLRYVVEAKDEGGALVLRTVNAPPQVAFKKMHLKAKRDVPDFGASSFTANPKLRPLDEGGGGKQLDLSWVLFDGDGNESTTDDQVKASGQLGGTLSYYFGWDFAWEEVLGDLPEAVGKCLLEFAGALVGEKPDCSLQNLLPEIKIGYSVEANAKAKIEVTGVAYKGYEKKFDLFSTNIGVLWLGPIPVSVDLTIVGVLEGKASSRFAIRTGAEFKAGSTLEYSTKTGGKSVQTPPTFTFDPPAADATLGASAKGSIGPELSAKVFGFAGPTGALTAFANIEAQYDATPCFKASAGADLRYGFEIGADIPVLGSVELAKFDEKIEIIKKEIGTGSCKVAEGSNKLPPGSGADAETFQAPKYTPWSSTHSADGLIPNFPYSDDDLQWLDLDQSIDGRFVIAGSALTGLVKMNGDGATVWAKRYESEELGIDPPAVRPMRVVDSKDGNMFVLGYPYSILKVGQGGGLHWAKRFPDVPFGIDGGPNGNPREENAFGGGIPDGAGGVFAAASHQIKDSSPLVTETWLTHLDADGNVLWSKAVRAAGRRLYPITMAPADNGFVVSGFLWDGTSTQAGRRAFVAKVRDDGAVEWAKDWTASCEDGPARVQPKTSIRTSAGNTFVAGILGPYRRSFTAVVRPDGSIASQSNPWSTSGLSYMTITSVRELPTSGFVAAGAYTNEYEPRSTFLAGLDSAGVLQWAQQYILPPTDPKPEASYAAVRPTDDGGVFLVSYTTSPTNGPPGLWASKPFAKDGAITFNANGATRVTPKVGTGTCTIADSALALETSDLAVVAKDITLQVKDVTPSKVSHAP